MNPLMILQLAIPVITALPTVASSVSALVSAFKELFAGGHSPADIVDAVGQMAPAIAQAVVANTPHAPDAPAAAAAAGPASLIAGAQVVADQPIGT